MGDGCSTHSAIQSGLTTVGRKHPNGSGLVTELVKAQASYAEGTEFESWPSQTNDLQNVYLSLSCWMLGMTSMRQTLVSLL